jgi:uncharacterized protein
VRRFTTLLPVGLAIPLLYCATAVATEAEAPLAVTAGADRVVVLEGKTYLSGEVKAAGKQDDAATAVAWSKASGPGEVAFADADALKTTATFSATGDYVLKLTATKGALSDSSTPAVQVVAPPPEKHLEPVATGPYQIDSPLWNGRAKALIVNWIPKILAAQEPDGYLQTAFTLSDRERWSPEHRRDHEGYVLSPGDSQGRVPRPVRRDALQRAAGFRRSGG